MTTLGAVFLPQLPPERLREVARAADDAGLEELGNVTAAKRRPI